ncbi:9783_t:CDS:2, partial [Dentiscutata erythropus]
MIPNTPTNYITLYNKCWLEDSNKRPTLDEILNELDILSTESIKFIMNDYDLNYLTLMHLMQDQEIPCFDYLQFSGKKYALKSYKYDLYLDVHSFKQIKHE